MTEQINFNTKPTPAYRVKYQSIMLRFKRFFAYHPAQYTGYAIAVGLLIGLLIGWVFWPVEWTGFTPAQLSDFDRAVYLLAVAERYSFDGNTAKVQRDLGSWHGASYACQLMPQVDFDSQMRLLAMVYTTGERCK